MSGSEPRVFISQHVYNDNGGGQGRRGTMGLKREIHIAQPGRF